ncbi:hypothetical protein GQ457_17G000920 [Hibiscus cannabinus]
MIEYKTFHANLLFIRNGVIKCCKSDNGQGRLCIENEASLLTEVGAEIDEIKLELNTMKAFLDDADRRSGVVASNETDNRWVANVRDIAYEVEDVVDEFMYYFNKKQLQQETTSTRNNNGGVAVKLQGINKRIKSTAERNQRYRVFCSESRQSNVQIDGENHRNNWMKNLSESALFLKDDDLVGIDKAQRELLGWLTNQELQRTVTSVVGMGGLGKTTLIANTFNKQVVRQHFECCAWVTVSQQYVVTDLLKSLIKELYYKAEEKIDPVINLDSMSYRELVGARVNFLQPRRYLIVIDDVWSIKVWEDINKALPANMNGSRILLTTRKEDVASFKFGAVNHIHRLKSLPFDESLTLFCKKAFVGEGGQCPPHLVSSARRLVAKCDGLPLAIVALGGLMASKNSIAEWNGVYNNLNRELSENDTYFERLKYISLLSYYDLSYRLKQCFLYCCIFPEDYVIKRKRLIRLWMAEGFVEPQKQTIPEVVAERYLTELICRGLLQVVSRNESGRPKQCKMHDILREFAVSISKSVKFVAKSDGTEEGLPTLKPNGNRWTTAAKNGTVVAQNRASSRRAWRRSLRTAVVEAKGVVELVRKVTGKPKEVGVAATNGGGSMVGARRQNGRLPSGFKLMRMLDLEDTPINELPEELVNLFNLRYLNLTRTQVKELPKNTGKLYNLQFLELKKTQIKELPAGIVKLKNLRHLIAYRYNVNTSTFDYVLDNIVPSNICLLSNLQVLTFVEARGDFIKQLSKMTQLRRLGIGNVKETDEKNLCFAISKMVHLRYLVVKSCNEDELLKLDAVDSAPPDLEKLVLAGK